MKVTVRVRLFPTAEQEVLFWKFCGGARFAYNECLAFKKEQYEQYGNNCKVQDLIEHLQDLKYSDEYCWLQEIPEAITKQAIKDLHKAYKWFYNGISAYPKFKKKNKCVNSFYQRTDNLRNVDDTHIKITGIKTSVRIRKHKIIKPCYNPRVVFDGKYWFLNYAIEIPERRLKLSNEVLGIDLGVKELCVVSDGRVYNNINKNSIVKKLEKRKKRLQRAISRKYEMNKDGAKYNKTENIRKLEYRLRLVDRKLKNIRNTYIHTVTAELVKTKPKAIVMEDLSIKDMIKNKYLRKMVLEQCLNKFRFYLKYKTEFYGIPLVFADKYFASTKICSDCGGKKKFIPLSERTYKCEFCGSVKDRDYNASLNLKQYYFSH